MPTLRLCLDIWGAGSVLDYVPKVPGECSDTPEIERRGQEPVKKANGDPKNELNILASRYVEGLHIITLDDTDEILIYIESLKWPKAGTYVLGENQLRRLLREFKDMSNNQIGEVISAIRDLSRRPNNRELFDNDPTMLHVSNGWLNLNTGEFSTHTPDRPSLKKLNAIYNPNARCPAFEEYLRTTFEPLQIKKVVKMLGSILEQKKGIIKPAYLLYGTGRNGKTTLTLVLTAFTGQKHVSSVSLFEMGTDKFAMSDLFGMLLNVAGDMDTTKITHTGNFKNATGGGQIRAQRKGEPAFQFQNTATIVCLCNEIPESADRTDSYLMRWILINFPRKFEAGVNDDRTLIERLRTPEEMSGILNLALKGYRMIQKEGYGNINIEDARIEMAVGGRGVGQFVKECCIIGTNGVTRKQDFQRGAIYFNSTKRLGSVSEEQIGRQMADMNIRSSRHKESGKQAYFYIGISIKPTFARLLGISPISNQTIEEIEKKYGIRKGIPAQQASNDSELPQTKLIEPEQWDKRGEVKDHLGELEKHKAEDHKEVAT